MPRKRASTAAEQPEGTARKSAAKTPRARKTAARSAESADTPARTPRRTAAARKTAPAAATKRPARPATAPRAEAAREPGSNNAGPNRARRPEPGRRMENGHGNGNGGLPSGKTARDYADAKRALGELWDDITKQTYSTFDSITRRVEKSYEDARKNVTQGDVRYALDKTQSKLKSLKNSGSQAVVRLGKQAKLLYEMLRDAMAGKFKMPWVTVSAITAALLYFVSPLDVIPDFIPGIGWMDDALVISLAISVARMDLRRYIKENQLDPADYGL
ncbi:MAG TPA: DUF1232 domain-containing protein [bacterium]|jgi:uncharacterized membrane protein YkvA (DUF1232 family)